MDTPRTTRGLRSELSRVQAQVAELEATIRAIRDGEVDAFVVNSPGGSEVHTLHGPQEPYRILAEQMNEGAATLTAEGRILFCNRRLAEMAGRPAQLLLGSSIFFLLGEDERHLHPNLLSLACTKDVRIETRLMHPDRSPMAVQLSFSPIKIDGSDPMLCVVAADISELKQASRELNVVVRRLGLATDALHAGIWDWDVRTNILEWDDRMFEIYGIPRNTRMDYTTWAGTVVAEDLPAVEVMLQKVIASRSQGSVEFRINLPNGTVRYIQAAVGTILDDAGEVVRVVGINIETTARRFNEDLEHLVDRRTAQLRAANKELEEFAYVASHDLKAPLRVIDNASKWLEEDLEEHLTDETREHLTLLRSRVGRMEKLLDDLLDYARIGKATDNRYSETIAGNVLMGNVLALLDPGELTLSVSPRFADIQVCRMPLQQILMNLIGNAIKHHDKKKGHIEVAVEDNGDGYTFTVRDDGPGIPAQFHDQVFKMFQTLKPRDQVEGSGMGLALVRKNAELFGGVIRLESTEGEGSTFRLTWPKPQSLKKEAI